MATLTIFANFFINDEERLLRLKDSFLSFKNIDAAKWVINARGKYKFDVLFFLREHLTDRLIPYTLESEDGWFCDSRKMMNDINTDYVFFWVEDHINLIDVDKYKEIISDMKKSQSEYLCYSWWAFGRPKEIYKKVKKDNFENIESFLLDKKTHLMIENDHSTYIISMQGIFSNLLFKKIIENGSPLLRGYPRKTPFDFEKGGGDISWLPIKVAIPKYELFAAIDDDFGLPGAYSLQSRGLYPTRIKREKSIIQNKSRWQVFLRKNIKKILPKIITKSLIYILILINKLKKLFWLKLHGL